MYTDQIKTSAIISKTMVVQGDIFVEGDLELQGQVDGKVDVAGTANISGVVNGEIKSGNLNADQAKIKGPVNCTENIHVNSDSVILGNLKGQNLVVRGAIKGNLDIKGDVTLEDQSIVVGDIKSKTIQLDRGSIMQGKCDQCYADRKPVDVFKEIEK